VEQKQSLTAFCVQVRWYDFQTIRWIIYRRKRTEFLLSAPQLHSAMPLFTLSPHPGTWHVQYSSRDIWHGRRNVHAIFTDKNSLEYTYQEMKTEEIKSHQESSWKVVGNGKDGKLESWMKETEMGIEDPSGEFHT